MLSYFLNILISTGGNGCNVYSELAYACRVVGHCIEFRSTDFCPYTCPLNTEYKACGSSVVKTCKNYKEFSSLEKTFEVEGCFCPDDLVSRQ